MTVPAPELAARRPERFTFDSSDPREVADFFERSYNAHLARDSVRAGHHRMAVTQLVYGELQYNDVRFPASGFDYDDSNEVHIGAVLHGCLSLAREDQRSGHRAGEVFLAEPSPSLHTEFGVSRVTTLAIKTRVFDEVIRSSASGTLPSWRFTSMAAVDGAFRQLTPILTLVRDLLQQPDPLPPLVVAQATRLAASAVLALFPNTAYADSSERDAADAHPETVARAIAYIDSNPAADITLADIAAAACVTPRAVQLAFRRHLDTTPMAYLRRVRLDLAHHDLQRAVPGDGTTVTSVAYQWGFANPSRFAQHYHGAYGIPPSATLRA